MSKAVFIAIELNLFVREALCNFFFISRFSLNLTPAALDESALKLAGSQRK